MSVEQEGRFILPNQRLISPIGDRLQEKPRMRFGNVVVQVQSEGDLLAFESFDSTNHKDSYIARGNQIIIPYGGNAFCTYREGYFIFRYYKRRPDQHPDPSLGLFFGYKMRRYDTQDRQHIVIDNPDVEFVKAILNTPQQVVVNGTQVDINFEPEKN